MTIDSKKEGGINITMKINWFTKSLATSVLFLFSQIIILILLRSSATNSERDRQLKLRRIEELKHAKNSAIAQATQMLSHDVRRPFSMVQGLLSLLKSTENFKETKSLIAKFSPEVTNAISSVNGMISDILEVGVKSPPVTALTEIGEIWNLAILDAFQYSKNTKIKLTTNLGHKMRLNVDRLKLMRVFSNILINASEAMGKCGEIWIATQEINVNSRPYTEIRIGNSGSYIPEEKIHNLFDPFYSEGKVEGTGLGLAIAEKVINSHGGNIRCESSLESGVEFILNLPSSQVRSENSSFQFPKLTSEIMVPINCLEELTTNSNESEAIAEAELLKWASEQKKTIKVLVVDDEEFYWQMIENLIDKNSPLFQAIDFSFESDEHGVNNYLQKNSPDLILMDINLGKNKTNGFDLASNIKSRGVNTKICMHSNGGSFEFKYQMIHSGADSMIPKPISKPQFLRMLLSALENKDSKTFVNSPVRPEKHIIILDDNILLLESWNVVKGVSQKRFISPEELFAASLDSSLFKNALCIITDYHFGDVNSKYNGITFAKELRKNNIKIPIYLSTDSDIDIKEIENSINLVIPKQPSEAWSKICSSLF